VIHVTISKNFVRTIGPITLNFGFIHQPMKSTKDKAVTIIYARHGIEMRGTGGTFLNHTSGKYFIVYTGENQHGDVWPFISGFYLASHVATKRFKLARKKLVALKQCDKNFN
jgi:hypothetical protein